MMSADYPIYNAMNLPAPDLDYQSGAVFFIDKPIHWSSFRVVGLLRKLTGIKKVGHAGTLDPMATGLLILCTGKATKQIYLFQDAVKSYRATIKFGESTRSYDKETEADGFAPFEHVTADLIRSTLSEHFSDEIEQIPPMFSAIKHKGTPLYKMARKGKEVERKSRKVFIYNIDIVDFSSPEVVLDIICSKGTYIRSIADDLGKAMGTLAHLTGLIRTGIGEYKVEESLNVEQLIYYLDPDGKAGISI